MESIQFWGLILDTLLQNEMNSKVEIKILEHVISYIKKIEMTGLEQALGWVYLKTWGPNAKESLSN